MKKIASVGGCDIFEVARGDVKYVRGMFSDPLTDARTGEDVSHIWEMDFEPALKAIERGREKDYLSRYPYEDGMSDWDKACMRHPLFIISTKGSRSSNRDLISTKGSPKFRNILFMVPPTDMESAYITDNGEYWGDSEWEPLPEIVGDEKLANDILDEIYKYIGDVSF